MTERLPIGLNFISSTSLAAQDANAWFQEALSLCLQADALGFDHVKTVEHYLFDWGGATPNPMIFLAAVAARTRHLRLGTAAVLPAFHHPVQLASELAMLDQLSGGRLDAGFARGFLPAEFATFAVPMNESRRRFDEGVAQIQKLWTEPNVTCAGEFHSFQRANIKPPPHQAPHPPIFVAAVSTAESFRRAGAAGHHLMLVPGAPLPEMSARLNVYRQARAEAGFSVEDARIQVSVQAVSGTTVQEAMDAARAPRARYLRLLAEAISNADDVDETDYPGYREILSKIEDSPVESALKDGVILLGNAEDMAGQMENIRAAMGPVSFSAHINFGGISLASAEQTLHTLRDAGLRVLSSMGSGK